MSRPAILTAAIAAFAVIFGFISPLGSGSAWAASIPTEITLDAQNVEHDLQSDTVTATGDVQLRTGDMTLLAQHINMDLASHLATVIGPAKLVTDGRAITGQDIRYDWESGEGQILKPATTVEGIMVSGESARVGKLGYTLDASSFTKCNLKQPEYALQARQVDINSETNRLTAKGVSLWLFGHRVIPLPNLQMSLANTWIGQMSRERMPVPEVGYETDKGYYVSEELSYLLDDDTLSRFQLEYGSKEKLASEITLARQLPADAHLLVNGRYTQQGPNRPDEVDGSAQLTLSAGGFNTLFNWESRHDDTNQDLRFLPEISASRGFSVGSGSSKLTLNPTVSWGRISEDQSGVDSDRTEARIDMYTPGWSVAGGSVGISGGFRYDDYTGFDERQVVSLTTAYTRTVKPGLTLSLSHQATSVTGSSPFIFDKVDEANDLILAGSYNSASVTASGAANYDLGRGAVDLVTGTVTLGTDEPWRWHGGVTAEYEPLSDKFKSLRYELTRELHCFRAVIGYDQVNQELSVGVRLRL